jgi:hypothetical protein
MRNRGNDHLEALRATRGTQAGGAVPTLPGRWLKQADEQLELGGGPFAFRHRGGAHTPGDMMVWLPMQHVCNRDSGARPHLPAPAPGTSAAPACSWTASSVKSSRR